MSAQELVACLCREGDQHLALGETPLATAFYLAAVSCHAPSALRSVRAALPETRGSSVVATLEAWCRGDSQIPAIHWDGMAVVSLTGTLACAFLATLCPDHPLAALHSLAGLLAHGHHGEVVRRCGVLLDAHSQQSLELWLTRALAWVLSRTQVHTGVADYLQAFMESADRTVAILTQELNWGLLHCRRILYQLSYQGNPQFSQPITAKKLAEKPIQYLLLFSHSVISDSLRPCGLQHSRLPCPSPSLRICSNSCPLNQ